MNITFQIIWYTSYTFKKNEHYKAKIAISKSTKDGDRGAYKRHKVPPGDHQMLSGKRKGDAIPREGGYDRLYQRRSLAVAHARLRSLSLH